MGFLSGLLGGGGDGGASNDYNTAKGFLKLLSGLGTKYGGLASSAASDYGTDNAGYRSALANEENLLSTDPYTESRDTADLSQATNGADQQFQNADANLSANLARRGLSDSSQLAGGLSSLAGKKAGLFASAQNKLAYNKILQRQSNANQLLGLTSGVASQDYSRQTSALGAQQGIDSGLAGSYEGIGQQEQSRADSQNGLLGGLIGGVASVAGAGGLGGTSALMNLLRKSKQQQPGQATVNLPNIPVGSVGNASFNNYTGGI